MKRFISFIKNHKIIFCVVLIILVGGGYFAYQKIKTPKTEISYSTTAVEKGMLISSISGSGQVSASNQVDINPSVSGKIVALGKSGVGATIKEGDLLVQIDARDSARSLGEAQSSLKNAQLELEELMAPTDDLTLIQAENALVDAEDTLTKLKTTQANSYQETIESKQKAQDNLVKSYEDAYNTVSSVFLDLPNVMTGIYSILFSEEIADNEIIVSQNSNDNVLINAFLARDYSERSIFEKYITDTKDDYNLAQTAYDKNFDDYKATSRSSDRATVETLLSQTLETTKKIADAVKSEKNMLDYWVEYQTDNETNIYSDVTSYQTDLSSYTSKTNTHLSNLLSAQRSIEDYKESITTAERDLAEMDQNNPLALAAAERSITEKKQKLADLKAGSTELEIKSKQLAVQQKQNSLIKAQQDYADYFVKAPFDGTIAAFNVSKGDTVSSGTAIATLITDQKIAEITLNEIDVAQIKVGQKVTLTFDAVADLTVTGEVVEVAALGEVSSGVVSYDVKISFDVQDERVKSGMSVSVEIITESKADVLLAPINAVKTSGSESYVEVLVDGQVQKKTVVTGSSNDTMIEVTGLEEGEEVISGTTAGTGSTKTKTTSESSGGPDGGMMMMLR
ncbi:MAG: efflux RND transporter periplasmic adaptor subunit [Patescibacteria group bacterium]